MRVVGMMWLVGIVWIMWRGVWVMRRWVMGWAFIHDHIKDHLADLPLSCAMIWASDFEYNNPVIKFCVNNLCMTTAPLTSEQVLFNEMLALFDEPKRD